MGVLSGSWRVGLVSTLAAVVALPWLSGGFRGAEAGPSELDGLAAHLRACEAAAAPDAGCTGVVYLWTPRMPLSERGAREIRSAAEALGLRLDLVRSDPLGGGAAAGSSAAAELAARLSAAGATLHAPALVVHRGGRFLGGAILGYKEAEAYRSLVEARLAEAPAEATASGAASAPAPPVAPTPRPLEFRDYAVPGSPGAYFRWVPGRNAIAFETAARVWLLDLDTGERLAAPGYVDFVPTPDGRFFVTPSQGRTLEFYDAERVFSEARAGRGRGVGPFYVDREMRDQYPSVGILQTGAAAGGGTRTVYRVLTSWFDRVAFRDYEVLGRAGAAAAVRPLGPVTDACPGLRFSIPILSQDGREVAGRDEESATTKIYRLADDGRCTEVTDLKLQSGKVAWNRAGTRLAFAIPEGAVRDGSGTLWQGTSGADAAGIFVFDRAGAGVERVEASVEAKRLTFPEFVGEERVIFLLPGGGGESRFRLVCCLPPGAR